MTSVGRCFAPVALGGAMLVAGCLGLDTSEPPPPPPDPVIFRSVSVGDLHACGVTTGREVFCWGGNGLGQLGVGSVNQSVIPQPVIQGDLSFDQVSAGGTVTCALANTNDIYCWGSNVRGQLGIGVTSPGSVTPTLVVGDHEFTFVTAGTEHVCGLTADSVGICWGLAESGRLGNQQSGVAIPQPSPDSVAGDFRWIQLSAGSQHTCGLVEDGTAYCWGAGTAGQLGTGMRQNFDEPTAVSGGLLFQSIDAGGVHTCGIDDNNEAYCWGEGSDGQLGTSSLRLEDVPVLVEGGHLFQDISAGGSHTCGVVIPTEAFCWGRNADGQLGDGSQSRRDIPTAVLGSLDFGSVSAGFGIQGVSCGFTLGSRLIYCWGDGSFGQIGNGVTTGALEPTRVSGQEDVAGPGS